MIQCICTVTSVASLAMAILWKEWKFLWYQLIDQKRFQLDAPVIIRVKMKNCEYDQKRFQLDVSVIIRRKNEELWIKTTIYSHAKLWILIIGVQKSVRTCSSLPASASLFSSNQGHLVIWSVLPRVSSRTLPKSSSCTLLVTLWCNKKFIILPKHSSLTCEITNYLKLVSDSQLCRNQQKPLKDQF